MRVFQIQDDWGMANLKIAERPQPQPQAGQVLLRMRASSLNFRDLVVPERGYGSFTGTLPLIPRYQTASARSSRSARASPAWLSATASARPSSRAGSPATRTLHA
jgi:hypothetical protein